MISEKTAISWLFLKWNKVIESLCTRTGLKKGRVTGKYIFYLLHILINHRIQPVISNKWVQHRGEIWNQIITCCIRGQICCFLDSVRGENITTHISTALSLFELLTVSDKAFLWMRDLAMLQEYSFRASPRYLAQCTILQRITY